MAQTTYDETNSELHNAYVGTAQESMEKAAHEICAGGGGRSRGVLEFSEMGGLPKMKGGGVFLKWVGVFFLLALNRFFFLRFLNFHF